MNTIIQTPTPNIETSKGFYKNLRFTTVSDKDPFLISDGKVLIEINPDRFARAGVKLVSSSWQNTIEELKKWTSITTVENGYLLSDPTSTWIYLIEASEEKDYELTALLPSILGNNAGLSLESTDISLSMKIWKTVGFTMQQGSPDQGWITLTNSDGVTVSLMTPNTCPHLFFNPSLAFFNGENNLAIIDKIRVLNIPITEEITHFNSEGIVDNIIVRDPGGLGFFLFND